jgi:TetR/AcrR family fatty acid metabolism transcriptional regulator
VLDQAERVLEAAGRLFGARRFHEVRMEDIATAADVGKGTLYRYFSDKDHLYLALLKRAAGQYRQRIEAAEAAVEGARAKLTALVGAVIGFFDEQPHVFDLIQRAEVLGGFAESWQPTREAVQQQVLELFDEGRRRGEFTVADPETASWLLLGGVRAVVRFGRRPRPAGLARAIVESVLCGAASLGG